MGRGKTATELSIQASVLDYWTRAPGLYAQRLESGSNVGVPDLHLASDWVSFFVELKIDSRALVHDSSTLAVPGRLTGPQRVTLLKSWGRPMPSLVLHCHVIQGWWVAIPAPLIPEYLKSPWVDFKSVLQYSRVEVAGPREILNSLDLCWRRFRGTSLLGPGSPVKVLQAMSMAPGPPPWLLGTSGAQDGALPVEVRPPWTTNPFD